MQRGRSVSIGLTAALCLGLAAAPALAGHYKWTTSGPEPGMVFQIVVNPADPNRIQTLAGLYGQLVFQTANQGQTWAQSESLLYSSRMIQDPSDANVLYALGFSGSVSGVLKTVDGGTSWFAASQGLPSTPPISAIGVAPSAPSTVYALAAGTPGLVFRSVDGAASWDAVPTNLSAPYLGDLVVQSDDASTLYAAAYPGIVKSSDGGATWVPLAGSPNASRLVIDARPPITIYASVVDSGVSRSVDAGSSWQPINGGIETQNVRDLALHPTDPSILYAASMGGTSGGGGLYRTTDGGTSWQPVDLGVPVNFATAVSFDPSEASRIYAAASQSTLLGGLFASVDGGVTWTTRNDGLSGYISHALACDGGAPEGAYGVSNAKVYRTDDRGGGWTLRGDAGSPIVSLAVDPSDSQTLYGASLSLGVGGVVKSVDGGVAWNPAADGITASNVYQLSISPSAPDHLLLAAFEGLYATTDGGGAWSSVLSGELRSAAFDPVDSSILYAGLWSSAPVGDGLLRSTDGGATWSPPAGVPTAYAHVLDIEVPKNDPSHVYAAFGQGVYRSVDHGLSFAPANTGFVGGFWPIHLVSDPADPATVYAAGQPTSAAIPDGALPDSTAASFVYRTRNGADMWVPVPGLLPALNGPLDFGVAADGRTLYASTLSGVFTFRRDFTDVPDADPFWASVDAAAMNGATSGCGSGRFCPTAAMSRASVAVFLLRGKNGGVYQPPPATGDVFADVPIGSAAADFIEELAREGVTAGCGGGDYCPDASLTRAQTAVLFLKMEHGADYAPPPATGTIFADVPADAFAASWIEQLFAEGITAGCGSGDFCPGSAVTRAQAAAFLVRTFGLS